MSHFTVLVLGDDPEAALAPFQENNMGDCPEEFLAFHDMTEEIEQDWSTPSITRYLHPDGRWLSWGDPDMQEYAYGPNRGGGVSIGGGVVNEPVMKEVLPSEVYDTKEEYVENYHGYEWDEGQKAYGYWENPNAKWDWYVLGGRWRGFFTLKEGAEGNLGEGTPFTNTSGESFDGRVDQAMLGDIDWEARGRELAEKGKRRWAEAQAELEGGSEDKARAARFRYDIREDETEEQYIARWRGNVRTFAVIKDGMWHQRGEKGWWNITHDDMGDAAWQEKFDGLLADLPPDSLLSVYDCHI